MNLDYSRIIDLFNNNIGPLSVDGTPLNEFFDRLPVQDRSQAEYFIRTELGGNPINESTEIVSGEFWDSEGIQNLEIPETIEKCADAAFKGSDLENVLIKSDLGGVLNLDIFAGANNLKSITVDPSIAGNIKSISTKACITRASQFVLRLPGIILDGLMNGSIPLNATKGGDQDYLNQHIEEI